MKYFAFSVILPLTVVSMAAADPFSNLSAHGHAQYSVYAQTTNTMGGSSNTIDLYDDHSLYAGGGDYVDFYETWTYAYDLYVGDDEYGNPIYQTYYEDQTAYAHAEGNAYGRFERSGNTIDTEVYGYASSNSWSSGSYAYASANAFAYGAADVTFTLLAATAVHITTSTSYGNGILSLYRGGDFITDSHLLLFGNLDTVLPAGDYSILGDASDGGANISIQAVPEPATMAALGLGLGALAVLRRRRRV
jgi:hypothetical protein